MMCAAQVTKFSFSLDPFAAVVVDTCERWYDLDADQGYVEDLPDLNRARDKFAKSVDTNAGALPEKFEESCWLVLQKQLGSERFWRMTMRVLRHRNFEGIGPHVDLNLYGPCLCVLFYHCRGDVQTYTLRLTHASQPAASMELQVGLGEGYIMWSHHTSQWVHQIEAAGDMEERGIVVMGFATESHRPHAFDALLTRFGPQFYHWRRTKDGNIVASKPAAAREKKKRVISVDSDTEVCV